jgi:hypothetical protein
MILCVKLSNLRPKPSFKLIKPHMVEFTNISNNIGAHKVSYIDRVTPEPNHKTPTYTD